MLRPTIFPKERATLTGATRRPSIDGDDRPTEAHPLAPRPDSVWPGDPDADRALSGLRHRSANVPRLRGAELPGGHGSDAVYRSQLRQDVGRLSFRRFHLHLRAERAQPARGFPGRLGNDPGLLS